MNKVEIKVYDPNGKLIQYDNFKLSDEFVEILFDNVDNILVEQIIESEE